MTPGQPSPGRPREPSPRRPPEPSQRRPLEPTPQGPRPRRRAVPPAPNHPVARVAVDVSLAHLDRPFDYLVPATLDAHAQPGCRVRVRFAGRLLGGLVLDRVDASTHRGRLTPIASAPSAEPVLSPEVAALARAVADQYAGTLADVLRLAVPPRHARVEAEVTSATRHDPLARPPPGSWQRYDGGPEFLQALAERRLARAVWCALPGGCWALELAVAVAAAVAGGRGALVVVPDGRDVARVDAALRKVLGPGRHVALTAELGPAERYRRWLAVRRGQVCAVVGPRAAAFAPVADLGLVAIWDDGDDLHAEPRAPYPHAREVLVARAQAIRAAALVGGYARSADGEALLRTGWARPLTAGRRAIRAAAPRVTAAGGDAELARDPGARTARLPTLAWAAARAGLAAGGPVLVQVPRRGYLSALSCARCRLGARCAGCGGPLAAEGGQRSCRWCGRPAADWVCPRCASRQLRAAVVGARRTAEELGRAFPDVAVVTSGGDSVVDRVPAAPGLVVATPGAEPSADGGYRTVLLLDGWLLLGRPDLRAAEEALRRWFAAAALARPAGEGGRVVVMADAGLPTVQALIRWDPAGAAQREVDERVELGFPPAVRLAAVTGPAAAVADLLAAAALPDGTQVLGPVQVAADPAGALRVLLRVPRPTGALLTRAVAAAQAVRSARKSGEAVRVVVDPVVIG